MRIKKIFLLLAALFLLFLTTYALLKKNNPENLAEVCFSNKCFKAELATTEQQRERGLMFRESLAEDRGMLFVFYQEEMHPFWMKNTLIPLDIIWVSKDFQVVSIQTADPCKEYPCKIYFPDQKALYVLELNAGSAEKFKIYEGEKIKINFPNKKD